MGKTLTTIVSIKVVVFGYRMLSALVDRYNTHKLLLLLPLCRDLLYTKVTQEI